MYRCYRDSNSLLVNATIMRNVLITGANRGIGLEFVKQFLALKPEPPKHLFAVCRNLDGATELKQLSQEAAKSGSHVHLLQHDVTDYKTIDALVEQVDKVVGAEGLTVLLNNAGVLTAPDRLADVEPEVFLRAYETNTIGPAMLTKKFWPLLKRAAAHKKDGSFRADKAAVLNISSLFGSVSDCGSGGCIAYRCSKAALNMVTRCSSIDMRADEILVVAFSPGSVRTGMTNNQGRMEPIESVGGMMQTISQLNESHNGKFVSFRNELQPY